MKLVVFAVAMLAAASARADEATIYQSPSGSTYTYFHRDPAPQPYTPPPPSAYEIEQSIRRANLIDRLSAPHDHSVEDAIRALQHSQEMHWLEEKHQLELHERQKNLDAERAQRVKEIQEEGAARTEAARAAYDQCLNSLDDIGMQKNEDDCAPLLPGYAENQRGKKVRHYCACIDGFGDVPDRCGDRLVIWHLNYWAIKKAADDDVDGVKDRELQQVLKNAANDPNPNEGAVVKANLPDLFSH